ncbi:MAG: hypothetical protein MUP03_01515 [Anaerolineales bacterium]|nr:hypothetical protein [Anaerolineales bacterium]
MVTCVHHQGLSWAIRSSLKTTGEFSLSGVPADTMAGFHLSLPARWQDDLLLLS